MERKRRSNHTKRSVKRLLRDRGERKTRKAGQGFVSKHFQSND